MALIPSTISAVAKIGSCSLISMTLPITLTDFLSADNVVNKGGQLTIHPIFNTDDEDDTILGVEIQFSGDKLRVNYHTDSREAIYDSSTGLYLPAVRTYLGSIDDLEMEDSAGLVGDGSRNLREHSLLAAFFNEDDTQDNLLVTDG